MHMWLPIIFKFTLSQLENQKLQYRGKYVIAFENNNFVPYVFFVAVSNTDGYSVQPQCQNVYHFCHSHDFSEP